MTLNKKFRESRGYNQQQLCRRWNMPKLHTTTYAEKKEKKEREKSLILALIVNV